MSKLREKFQEVITKEFNKAEQCEQIADDFAVKFAEWKDKNTIKAFDSYYFENEAKSTAELLQIFKDKYYK